MKLSIYRTEDGFSCGYMPHSYAGVHIEDTKNGFALVYFCQEQEPENSNKYIRHAELEGYIKGHDRENAETKAIETIKRNIRGLLIHDDHLDFTVQK